MGRAPWEVWRPRLLWGMPSASSGLAGLPGGWATSCCAFDAKVASTRVPSTHHHVSWQATCRACVKPGHAALHTACPSKTEGLLRAAYFGEHALLGPLETQQHLAAVQVSSLRKRAVSKVTFPA